jgi:hypothetical protein
MGDAKSPDAGDAMSDVSPISFIFFTALALIPTGPYVSVETKWKRTGVAMTASGFAGTIAVGVAIFWRLLPSSFFAPKIPAIFVFIFVVLGFAVVVTGVLLRNRDGRAIIIIRDMAVACGALWFAVRYILPVASQQFSLPTATSAPTAIEQATPFVPTPISETSSPSVRDWRNIPASPWGGPIGPIMALELVATFNRLPKPCLLKFTGPANDPFVDTIGWLLSNGVITNGPSGGGPFSGSVCEIASSTIDLPDVDDPNPIKLTTEPGIVVHWNESYSPGSDIVHYFDSSTLRVSISHRMPKGSPANLIWIDVGPGSPWKE